MRYANWLLYVLARDGNEGARNVGTGGETYSYVSSPGWQMQISPNNLIEHIESSPSDGHGMLRSLISDSRLGSILSRT
jgi:hypothetical protein